MTSPLPDDRELVMRRISEALRLRRDHVEPHLDAATYRNLLPRIGDTLEERIEHFRLWSERLQTEFLVCSRTDLPEKLNELRQNHGWHRAACHGADLARQALSLCRLDSETTVRIDDAGIEPYDKDALETCDVSFTVCDALVAQTGSVLLTARSAGGRALSVLPPHHVVLANADQLVPDLPAAMTLIRERYGDAMPSLVTFHTGPSRTGDIERTIVLGAHGPKK
ncbi:MAG: LUD domain-containing protein, partial [Verrucomicrobiae bacterium]|nr:LUD domain-containing protein [Verrucomicrobiae bacterium]